MAKAMNITDVFKALLGGGYIVEKCPAVTGKSKYSVIMPGEGRNPGNYVGHVTGKQFEDLAEKCIVVFAGDNTDKYGNISNRYCLEQFLGDESLTNEHCQSSEARDPVGYDRCTCPRCDTYNEVIKKRRNTVAVDVMYCWHCGQAILVRQEN